MTKKEYFLRVREDFVSSRYQQVKRKSRLIKENGKIFTAGEWLRGCFIKAGDSHMFRTGDYLLNPSRFDRVKFSATAGGGMSKDELKELLDLLSGYPRKE